MLLPRDGSKTRSNALPGAVIMDEIVGELGELIEDDVLPVARELGALVVDLLDVALGAGRADDVGGLGNPLLQPVEALAAHAGGKHGDAAAAEDARNRDAAAAVIAGRRPDRAVVRRIELAGDQPRHEAGIGRQHLVRADHRKAAAEQHDDRRLHAGQFGRQHHVARHRHPLFAARIVEPVHAPEIGRVRRIGIDAGEIWRGRAGDVGGVERARSRSAA